jgi:hypothetical protein
MTPVKKNMNIGWVWESIMKAMEEAGNSELFQTWELINRTTNESELEDSSEVNRSEKKGPLELDILERVIELQTVLISLVGLFCEMDRESDVSDPRDRTIGREYWESEMGLIPNSSSEVRLEAPRFTFPFGWRKRPNSEINTEKDLGLKLVLQEALEAVSAFAENVFFSLVLPEVESFNGGGYSSVDFLDTPYASEYGFRDPAGNRNQSVKDYFYCKMSDFEPCCGN